MFDLHISHISTCCQVICLLAFDVIAKFKYVSGAVIDSDIQHMWYLYCDELHLDENEDRYYR